MCVDPHGRVISPLLLYRDESCDFKLQVPSVCDRHAKLRVDNSGMVCCALSNVCLCAFLTF